MSTEADVRAKVADFGLSRRALPSIGDQLQTWQWLAPEVFAQHSREGYDGRSDVYSFGIVMWEICCGPGDLHVPFEEYERKEQQLKREITTQNLRPTLPKETPRSLVRLIEQVSV